ncbi:MAG TPA: AMP-binding protein [Kineosporiaceae bacterium]|jgi:phenylacetate-coenzyme A ligase PaaK-like adenylate-forming protein|nr:AMP-binding protein [Kineosporiaceae bacterium]
MFETGVRQLRMVMSMVWGRRIDPANLTRLVDDALATIAEFGEPGDDVQTLTEGPFADAESRRGFADGGLRRTARRLGQQSPFYARRFAAAEVDPARMDTTRLRSVPVTVKADLVRQQRDFVCADAPPHLATRTTGTTGQPAEIWLSRYETALWPALGALAGVLRDDLRVDDVMQVNVSSRATASVQLDVATLRLAHGGCRVLGLVPPDEALDSLADGQVTLLATVPSYLGELVVAARRRGATAADFGRLRRIDVGGEVLSPALAVAAAQTFGVPGVNDVFGMTEVLPVTGRTCSARHLHHDLNMGHVECLDLDTGEPAEPGALATVVITPYFPYRDCMPVFRYDTRDVVRVLPDGPLECEVAAVPGTSQVLGKADHLLRTASGVVTPRELVEAVEALPTDPWPARFRAVAAGGRIALTLPASAVDGLGVPGTADHFAARGLDVEVSVVPDDEARQLRTLRCDLRETTFVNRPALIGA